MKSLRIFQVFGLFYAVVAKDEPRFVGPGQNVTVVVGRDATLTCKMENLHNYKVAWLRVDTQTILTIGSHVITKNHRVGVARGDRTLWALTLREVRPEDGGQYMCQINTEPMITQTHLLQVVVPPDIVESGTSSEVMVREGDNVTLHCSASGTPAPNISWRREDFKSLRIRGDTTVNKWSGEWLNMSAVARELNGPFLCIATNGVPPSVSKRILLHVLCAPTVWAIQKLIGGYIGSSALLQCNIEANPLPAVYWTHIDSPRLQYGSKYQASMKSESYHHVATLIVSNISREDIGTYYCHVQNSLGNGRGDITLYTLAATSTTTTSSTDATTLLVTQSDATTDETYVVKHLEDHQPVEEDKEFSAEDNYVVVLSQQQMQNFDFSSSS